MEEDEFGDFGGFEAADPVAPEEARPAAQGQGVEASPSPWAVFAASAPAQASNAAVGLQPDLIRAQAPVAHSPLDPTFPPGGAASTPGPDVSASSQSAAALDSNLESFTDFAAFGHNLGSGAGRSLSEQVLEPHFGRQVPPSGGVQGVPDGVLDLDLSGKANREGVSPEKSAEPSESGISVDTEASSADSTDRAPSPTLRQPAAAVAPPREPRNDQQVAALQAQLSLAEEEKQRINNELQELLAKYKEAEENLEQAKKAADDQKEAYEKLQTKHSSQLEEIRQAGHEALTVIVEEYKELCRVTVREQQETSQRELTQALKEQTEQCKEQMKSYEENFTKVLEDERSQLQEKLQKALNQQSEEYKEALEKALKEEREKSEAAIKKATEEERETRERLLQEALDSERKKSKQCFEEEQERLKQVMTEERVKNTAATEKALEDERSKCKDCIKTALSEERQKHEQMVKDVMEKAREEMKAYVQEQRKEDSAIRRRSLASMDLFLESARKQLQLLLNPEDAGDS